MNSGSFLCQKPDVFELKAAAPAAAFLLLFLLPRGPLIATIKMAERPNHALAPRRFAPW
jgi:hypothetical protein